MPKLTAFLAFFAILLGTLGGAHALVWWRLVRQTQLPLAATAIATAGLIFGLLAIPVALAVGRRSPGAADAALWVAYVWLGFFFYLFLAAAGTGLLHAALGYVPRALLPAAWASASEVSIARVFAAASLALATGVTAYGLRDVARGPHVVALEVALPRLPRQLDGLKVAQISDLHVAALLRRPYVERVVRKVQALQPDLLVYTGDLVDGAVPQLAHDIAPLAQVRPPLGSYVITGNHEYYSGADAWLAHYASLGLQPLRNARVEVGRDGASFDLAGIDDWTAHNFGHGHGANLPAAIAGRDTSRCLVLLAHQPRAAAEAESAGVDLMLSGHTHGGQLWPFSVLVRVVQPYVSGLARRGNMQVYVNRGTGYWGMPMRVGAPAEITLLTLRAGAAG